MSNFQLREAIYMAISLILTTVLILVCVIFTRQAKAAEYSHREAEAFISELRNERYWRKFEGAKTGADVIDFIIKHKDMCDIVIRDSALSANSATQPYLLGDALIMGLSDEVSVPDYFWHVSYAYFNILGGDGAKKYTATLLYDGQLAPEYANGIQVRGGVITGVEFREGS